MNDPGPVRRLRCPRCRTTVTAGPDAAPACPACGFQGQAPPATVRPPQTSPAPPAPVATAAAPTPPPAAAPAPVRTRRARAALLTLCTLGAYTPFWWWRASRAADAHGAEAPARPVLKASMPPLLVAPPVGAAAAALWRWGPGGTGGLLAATTLAGLAFILLAAGTVLFGAGAARTWRILHRSVPGALRVPGAMVVLLVPGANLGLPLLHAHGERLLAHLEATGADPQGPPDHPSPHTGDAPRHSTPWDDTPDPAQPWRPDETLRDRSP